MSPILVRPIREEFEHDRVIRLLLSRLRRRYLVAVNLDGEGEATGVRSGTSSVFPDLVLSSSTGPRRIHGIVEVETVESVNHLEAMAEWVHFGRVRGAFYLYVPAATTEVARRLCEDYSVAVSEIWGYHAVGDQIRFTMTFRTPRLASQLARSSKLVSGTSAKRSARKTGTESLAKKKTGNKGSVKSASRGAKAGRVSTSTKRQSVGSSLAVRKKSVTKKTSKKATKGAKGLLQGSRRVWIGPDHRDRQRWI